MNTFTEDPNSYLFVLSGPQALDSYRLETPSRLRANQALSPASDEEGSGDEERREEEGVGEKERGGEEAEELTKKRNSKLGKEWGHAVFTKTVYGNNPVSYGTHLYRV